MGLLFFVQKVNNNSKTFYSNFDFDKLKFLEKLAVNKFITEKYKKIYKCLYIHRILKLSNTSTI